MPQRGPIGVDGVNGNGQPPPLPEETPPDPEDAGAQGYGESPRKPRPERKDAFDVGGWLLQGLAGLSEELRHNDLGLPEEFWVHAYAARKEALLAVRVLVDAALESCTSAETTKATEKKKPPQRGQVSIDFG